ncbi:hypothetical protein LF887_14570 [Chryseobacterium sp. MEBOG06]|uniref:hypothetical protein n=1 Tax=Chryseobacterium sp. MEBOG06 TaxID=2879938 RepID=UPI001F315FF8|nr:hypothetical protein [Chryseobacterium sp. MEBOG06]UKB82228.1 hypothetical protein LF887_14570 [Chryseobacterium sp. MEBOG06]
MIVKKQILNKILSLLFVTLMLCNCSAQKINLNNVVDTYINYNSSKNKMFNPANIYLLMGLFSEQENLQNKILSLSYSCFECNGNVSDKETVVQYKGYKVVITTDNTDNKAVLLKYFKNITPDKTFHMLPFDKNIIYDSPAHLGIRFDNKGKVYFVCMGGETKEIKQMLGFRNDLEDCQQ